MYKILFVSLLPVLLWSNALEETLDNEREWLEEETFVVSASRVKEDIKKTAASVTVIESETIEQMGANNLLDVLRTVPGLGIHQSQLYINEIESRGVKTWFSEKVLIMLDGHSLNRLQNGGATLQYDTINLENVERIEIVRGPASALYGENAFTALINIITKKAEDIDGTIATIKAGSYNTQSYNLLFGKKIDDISITANLNYLSSDGYKAFVAQDAVGQSGYTDPTTEKKSLHLNVESKGFYLMGQYTDRKEGPRFGVAKVLTSRTLFHYESYFAELGYKMEFSDTLSLHARIYYDNSTPDNKIEFFPKGFPTSDYTDGLLALSAIEEEKQGSELLFTYKDNSITIVSGIFYEKQIVGNAKESYNYNPITLAPLPELTEVPKALLSLDDLDRDVYAIYSELLYDVNDDIRLTIGGRYDYYSDIGDTFNPRMGATWQLNNSNTLKMMYGEAFRAPTFAELYNKNNPAVVGNPDLIPETIKTFELSYFNNTIDNTNLTFTYFRNDISNIIVIDDNGKHQNNGDIETQGLEAEIKYNLGRGSYVLANYTYQNPQNLYTNAKMTGVSRHKAYAAINYRIDNTFNFYVDANYKSEEFRELGDLRKAVDSSTILNATLLAKDIFKENMKLRLSIYNLLDEKDFNTASSFGYPLAERSLMAEISYKF